MKEKDEIAKRLGANIANARRARGLTQVQVAKSVFVTAQAVSKWESGKSQPDVGTLFALSRLLGVTADELLK